MSFDNTKYDVELNGVGFRVENYRKSEFDPFIPRLGSGTQSESEFDLLKSRSIESFKGGMLQRQWTDDNAYFGSENLYPVYDDGVLYPVKSLVSKNDIMGKSTVTATCQTKDYLWINTMSYGVPTNTLKRIAVDGTVVSITLSPSLASSGYPISDLVVWGGKVWGTIIGTKMFNFDIASTTAVELTSGVAGSYDKMIVYQGFLYGIDQADNNNLLKFTGTSTSRQFVSVGTTGNVGFDSTAKLILFNGRVFLFRSDGIWAYDGIRLAPVDSGTLTASTQNYRYPCVLKGYLYYFMQDGMYRFNGNMIEKIYDKSEVGFPVAMVAGNSRLWIVYNNSQWSGSSRYDKSMGYDFSLLTTVTGRVACFDGKSIFTYGRTDNNSVSTPDFSGQGENNWASWFADSVFVFTNFDKGGDKNAVSGTYFKSVAGELTQTGTSAWKFVTSIFDADFAMIDKTIENTEIVLDTDATADETITIEYRTTNFGDNTGWATFGTFKTQTKLQESVYNSIPAGLKFRRIQFRLSGTTSVLYGFKKFVLRFLLVPDFHWQWNFAVNAYGDNLVEPLMLKDGTQSTQAVSLLRSTVYTSRELGTPIGFCDIDQYDLTVNCTNVATTLSITTAMLKSKGKIKIGDEIIKYTGKTSTTITGCTRGYLGTTAVAHTTVEPVFAYYQVLVRKIQQERIEMDDSDLDKDVSSSKPSQISLIIQEV